MYHITHAGLDALQNALKDIENIPDDVQKEMLNAQEDIVEDAQVYTAGTMLKGPYYKGAVALSVSKGKVKRKKSGLYLDVSFKGEQHGNRLAEIAFVNEYGKKSQPARPFIAKANEGASDTSAKAGADVYDKWLKSKGL